MIDASFFDESYFTRGNKSDFGLIPNNKRHIKAVEDSKIIVRVTEWKPGKTLVVGSALGHLVKILTLMEIDAYGSDISEYAVNNTPEEIRHKCKVVAAQDLSTVYQCGEFDTTIAFGVLEHIPTEELERAISQIGLVTNQWLLINLPIWYNDKEVDQSNWSTDKSHVSIHTPEWWESKFSKAGFHTHFRYIQDNTMTLVMVKNPIKERGLLWVGPPYDQSGYGEASRGYLYRLHTLGRHPVLRARRFWRGSPIEISPEMLDAFTQMESRSTPYKNYDVIQNITPENYKYYENADRIFAYTPFETDGLPLGWVLLMKACNTIFVPSEFNVQTYKKYGITAKVVPHGVNSDRFKPGPKTGKSHVPMGYYTFGANFDWNDRKNPKALIEAYLRAFNKDSGVLLAIKTFSPMFNAKERAHATITEIKNSLGRDNYAPIWLSTETVSTEDMPLFYNDIDCFVSTSRGEGWGLGVSEAMAAGLPVITTVTGNTFCNEKNCIPLKGAWEWINWNTEIYKQNPNYRNQKWFEADINDLVVKMQDIVLNNEVGQALGEEARKCMLPYTWENATKIMLNHLETI